MHNKSTIPRLHIGTGVYFLWALSLLILPLRWVAAVAAAAIIHELFHYIAIKLTKGQVLSLEIRTTGLRMQISNMSFGKELVCALAGPLGSFLLLSVSRWFPRTAVCAVFHGLYNLLPVYPLDGGRALRSAAYLLLPAQYAERVCSCMQTLFRLLFLLAAIYAVFSLNLGLLPVLMLLLLILKTNHVKISCKQKSQRVQ